MLCNPKDLFFLAATRCVSATLALPPYLDTLKPQYNILKTAGSLLGYKHSERTIAKLKAHILTEAQKVKHLEGIKKLNSNKDHKNKLLEQLKRINESYELKAKRIERLMAGRLCRTALII